MKALLEGLGVLTAHVKGYTGDRHQKQEITIQSVSLCKGKFHKGSKSHESCAAKGIPEHCAIVQFDEKILVVTSRDIVSAEAHYLISCFKNYTRDSTKKNLGTKQNVTRKKRQAG